MSLKIIEPFKTKIGIGKLDFDLEYLKEYAEKNKNKYESRQKSNVGGYQTPDLPFDNNIIKLFQKILFFAQEYAKDYKFNNKLYVDNFWINFNKTSSSNMLHTHPNSQISGVYYIQVPENSGKILFENPHTFDAFSEIQSYSDDFKYDTSQYYAVDIQGKEGLLLVFPSYLRHGVHINKSELDRISISFNARVIE